MGVEMPTTTCAPSSRLAHPQAHKNRNGSTMRFIKAGLLCLLLCLGGLLLAGCASAATGTTAARVTPTASPTVRPEESVTVMVTVEQQGSVAAHNVHLLVTILVTNHTTRDIIISIPFCNSPNPPVIIEVVDTTGKTIWETNLWNGMCPLMKPRDAVRLAPNATQRWVITNDLSHGSVQYGNAPPGPPPLVANETFTVRATLLQWHQGSVEDIGNPSVPQGQDVVGGATIVPR